LVIVGGVLCALVALVAVVGLAGGFDRVAAGELPVVAEDEPNQGEPWNVTVTGAVLAADLEPAVLYEDGYWLAVIADVEVTAGESRTDLAEILYVTGVEGLAREHTERGSYPGATFADDIRLVRDGTAAASLHPGLPERVAFLWELAIDTPPPAEVHIEIIGKTYRESVLTGAMEWLDGAARAQLTVPVEDRREEA
jgi:hypothetical protein